MRIFHFASLPILLAAGSAVFAQGGGPQFAAPKLKSLPPVVAAPPSAQPSGVVAVPVGGDGQQVGAAVVVKDAPPPTVVVQEAPPPTVAVQQPPPPAVVVQHPPAPPPQRSHGYSYPRY